MNPVFHPYVITGFLTACVTLAVGVFVFIRKKRSSVHRAFLIFSASIAQWSFFTAVQAMQFDPRAALFWAKFCHIGAMLIPVFFYYFTLKITEKKRIVPLVMGYSLAVFLLLLTFVTPHFIPSTRQDVGVPNFTRAGPLYWVIIVFFSIYVCLSITNLWTSVLQSSGPRRTHLLYFFWASLFGFGVGVINFFPVYGVTFWPYPYSAICGAIYSCVIAYAILRHKLFDIELIIKKGLIFGALFAIVYATVSAFIFLIGCVLAKHPVPLLSGISIVLAMGLYEPLKKFLTNITNRFLFQKKIAYTQLVQELTDRLSDLRDPQALSEEIVQFTTQEMGLEWAALYLRSHENSHFTLRSSKGITVHEKLRESRAIETMLKRRVNPLILSPFDVEGDLEPQTKAKLRGQRIEVIIPIYLDDKLHGILLLGKKKSDNAFNAEDEVLLQTLMDQTSMLLLSAKLLRETNRSYLEFGQRIKMAALIKLSRGVHHEVRNPLHAISLCAGTISEDIRQGYHRLLSADDYLEKLNQRIQHMLGDIQRIRESLGRFARFARPEETDCELLALSLRQEIAKFLILMAEGQNLDHITIHLEIPDSFQVIASEGALQEILFNLFNNAYDAMNGKGELSFTAEEDSEWIRLKIRDSGPGIPREIVANIFEEYFTTKTDCDSTGIGLSISKHRTERLGGSIEANSELKSGAEFMLRLRKAS